MPLDHYINLSNYEEFINELSVVHSTESDKWIHVVTNPNSIIRYPVDILFKKNEQAAFQIEENKAIYDISLPKNCDYVVGISQYGTNPRYPYRVLCNGETLSSHTDRYVLVACPYTEIKIRLYFDIDQIPEVFGIRYQANIFSDSEIHRRLLSSNFDLDGVKYREGCILIDPRTN